MNRVVGRLAWDEKDEYHTPWMSFPNVTAFRVWCRDMRTAQGKPGNILKAEYHYVDGTWTADRMLAHVRRNKP